VISRAYYGAFHLAVQLLLDAGLVVDSNHGELQHDYLQSANKSGEMIGQLLHRLHASRVQADYRFDKAQSEDLAHGILCVEHARQIERLGELLRQQLAQPEAKAEFVSAIGDYRRKVGRRV
jgi:uncharacterized protein (UPF0332 family)